MDDQDIEKMITLAIDTIPIPWEMLWAVFQKIIQRTRKEKHEILTDNQEKL